MTLIAVFNREQHQTAKYIAVENNPPLKDIEYLNI